MDLVGGSTMSYKHEAIYTLYPNAVEIFGDEVKDSDGNLITIDNSAVTSKQTELENAEPLRLLRVERNAKLAETDWVVIKEREEGGSVSNFADWKTYRQALRDITNSATSLDDVTWPEKPE